eukprot:1687321-Rhodomonas_salina.2
MAAQHVELNTDCRLAIADVARASGIPVHELKARMPRAAEYLGNFSPSATALRGKEYIAVPTGVHVLAPERLMQLMEVVNLTEYQFATQCAADVAANIYMYDHPSDFPQCLVNAMRSKEERYALGLAPVMYASDTKASA